MESSLASFSMDTMMFQAEAALIHHYVGEVKRWAELEKMFAIFSDNQAALKEIGPASVDSKPVWDCPSALNELGSQKTLTLAWTSNTSLRNCVKGYNLKGLNLLET